MPRSYKSHGIILTARSYSDADKIFTIFSKDMGKVAVIAKGVKKMKSRKRGSLEVFNRINFQAVHSRGLDIITETEIIDSFEEIRKNLKKISVAYYMAEILNKLVTEGDKNERVYMLLANYLSRLKVSNSLKSLRMKFAQDVLEAMGYWPEGKKLESPDTIIEELFEKKLSSVRVGHRLLR